MIRELSNIFLMLAAGANPLDCQNNPVPLESSTCVCPGILNGGEPATVADEGLNLVHSQIWTTVSKLDRETFGEFHNLDAGDAVRILEPVGICGVNPGLHGVMRRLRRLEVGYFGFHGADPQNALQ